MCVCVCVCVSAALFSHLAQLRGKQEIGALATVAAKKVFCFVRKLERFLLYITSAILSRVHSPYSLCIPLGIPYKIPT